MQSEVKPENFMTKVLKNRQIVWLITHWFTLKSYQCLQSANLHFNAGKNIITAFVFILPEMKAVAKSNRGIGVHLVPLKYVKPRGKTSAFNLHEFRNNMPSEVRLENIWNLNCNKEASRLYAELLCMQVIYTLSRCHQHVIHMLSAEPVPSQ